MSPLARDFGHVLAAGGETENNVGKFSVTNTVELYTPQLVEHNAAKEGEPR